MVVDIRLLQGKIVEDLDQNPKNFSHLMEELVLEILSLEEEKKEEKISAVQTQAIERSEK